MSVYEPFERTGVFATDEEREQIQKAFPFLIIGNTRMPTPQETCHRIALSHGLPEITGMYGYDFRNGEFLHD